MLDLKSFELSPAFLATAKPAKLKRQRQHFVCVPWSWVEKLSGARGQTLRVAIILLYLHWKAKGRPVKLANGMLQSDGISRRAKWRALLELEGLGLISIERRPKKSPIIEIS
jgi:hypothetical protein